MCGVGNYQTFENLDICELQSTYIHLEVYMCLILALIEADTCFVKPHLEPIGQSGAISTAACPISSRACRSCWHNAHGFNTSSGISICAAAAGLLWFDGTSASS